MFSTKIRDGKSFAAEQKNKEIKKILLKSKRIEKNSDKRLKSNELIKKATNYLNQTRPAKYGFSPNQIKEKSLENIISQT